jgi:energy-coupling factor transporter ATP-binding protein EcfA2
MTEIPEIYQEEDDLKVSLGAVIFSDGTRVELKPSSVLLVVGPNNSGKSRSLSDIWTHLSAEGGVQVREEVKAVPEVEVRKHGEEAALGAWLDDHASLLPTTRDKGNPQYATIGVGNMFWSGLREKWANGPPFGGLSSFLFMFAGGGDRLDLTDSVGAIDLLTEPPVQPLQILYADAKRERELTDATYEAFGVPITVNRVSGRIIHLHVGEVPKSLGSEVPTNSEYRAAIESLPLISDQGDGIRAYVGLILLLVASEFSIVLVDEPEAFLHPPQERALGKRLAKQAAERGTQLVMATHSLDLLLGTLAQPDVDLTVVRLRRAGDVNRAAVLKPDRVKDLWADPIIRFSNVLDGIFHRGVVICEGDADATFYDATLTAALAAMGEAEHNLLFLHCSGRDSTPSARYV